MIYSSDILKTFLKRTLSRSQGASFMSVMRLQQKICTPDKCSNDSAMLTPLTKVLRHFQADMQKHPRSL